ncbi:ABC transporter permease [Streptomyces qinzhouensis]|uniref:ABC transporter permease n=1 Tax=Streptomyces qinzhouensis TaxID=2599401 RepID=A0A5B8IN48_9ACTN|nr:ABC transporter permease [Streptomyces qinzhouensis]QDY80078.1 ABC transporter permease [Streptomyces qinzhouensis]
MTRAPAGSGSPAAVQAAPHSPAASAPTAPAEVFSAALRSEWLKIVTVRSLCVALGLVFVATAGFTVLANATMTEEMRTEADFDPLYASFAGLAMGQVAAICFGAMTVAAEYRTRGIGLSLAAVPRRGVLYAAKLTVIGISALLVGLATSVVCFFAAQSLLGADGVGVLSPGAPRAIVGGGLYLALITVFAAALTVLLRSGPLVMGILIPFLIMVSFILGGPEEMGFLEFLPDHAGQQMLLRDPSGTLGAWGGLGVQILWVTAAVWAGRSGLLRRDA